MKLSVIAFSIGYKIGKKIKQLWEAIAKTWCNPPKPDYHFAMEILGR
ncbi:MAG: hypothetical protein F6K24_21355 [Okeania sp. SIO2D1]|nr:hypothetical protein [Okeania sp. SIO2D1]